MRNLWQPVADLTHLQMIFDLIHGLGRSQYSSRIVCTKDLREHLLDLFRKTIGGSRLASMLYQKTDCLTVVLDMQKLCHQRSEPFGDVTTQMSFASRHYARVTEQWEYSFEIDQKSDLDVGYLSGDNTSHHQSPFGHELEYAPCATFGFRSMICCLVIIWHMAVGCGQSKLRHFVN